jgi:hypothetical protein
MEWQSNGDKMTDYSKLFAAISSLYSQSREPTLIPKQGNFPFDQMYPGQLTVMQELKDFKEAALTSHTGSGKTAVFLGLARGESTIIIEPRKFLQKQVQTYYHDYVLFGKSEYPCKHAKNAALSSCQSRKSCELTGYHNTCPTATQTCLNKPCKVFQTETGFAKYPCEGCVYISAVQGAMRALQDKKAVICNFGNLWNLLPKAKVVVVDEADLFFREISSPTRMYYSSAKHNAEDPIKQLLAREQHGLGEAIKTTMDSKSVYGLQNKLYTIQFLSTYSDLCFKYQKKDKIYIEVSPDNVSILKDKLFKGKRLLIVSATLGDFNIPQHSYSVWQRRGIFFKPVGKMTSRNLALQPWLMKNAADAIEEISGLAEVKYDTNQFVIHCGNIGTHATQLNTLLGPENCTLHEKGNLMKTIDDFTESDMRYLLVASAEYGADFAWCKLQFVLKFPYASLDERMRVLERTMGKDKFNRFYLNDAITRFVQQCGRNVRGYGDFGATVVLDSKFIEVYRANEKSFPDWFREGFDGKVY